MSLADAMTWEKEYPNKGEIVFPKFYEYVIELRGGHRYSVVTTSYDKAFELVLSSSEPYYNEEWGYKKLWYSTADMDKKNKPIKQ